MGYFSLQTPLSRKLLFFVRPVLCGTIYVVCFNMQSLFFWLSTGNIRMSEPEARPFPSRDSTPIFPAHPIDQALTDSIIPIRHLVQMSLILQND